MTTTFTLPRFLIDRRAAHHQSSSPSSAASPSVRSLTMFEDFAAPPATTAHGNNANRVHLQPRAIGATSSPGELWVRVRVRMMMGDGTLTLTLALTLTAG